MCSNFIKLNRKIIEWEWWSDINTFRVFVYMLICAYWKDGNYRGILIPRGSFPSSIAELARGTNLTDNEIRTALKHLKSTGEITSKSTNKYTVFTVNNYDLYQAVNEQKHEQITGENTNEAQAINKQLTSPILKENKNIRLKEDKKKDITNVISKEKATRFSPPTLDDVKSYCSEKGYTQVDPEKFVDFYESKGWMVGKNKMKDWKAAVRNWARSQRQESTAKTTRKELVPDWMNKKNGFNNYQQRDTDYDDLERQLLEKSMGKADEP